jgi:hypothetical protein
MDFSHVCNPIRQDVQKDAHPTVGGEILVLWLDTCSNPLAPMDFNQQHRSMANPYKD